MTTLASPVVMTDPLFEIPVDSVSRMSQPVVGPTITDITTGVAGTGAFDLIMTSLKTYLQVEYEKSRITGADYTKTFIELTQAALQTALQFTLGKDQAFWASQQAQITAVTARVALETNKVQYDTTKIQKVTAQVQQDTATYTLSTMIPAQVLLVNEQMEAARAQTMSTRLDGPAVAGTLGKQVQLYDQQITSYKRDAEVKAAKPFTDAYITAKTLDDTITPPTHFTNDEIDKVLGSLMARNAFDGT